MKKIHIILLVFIAATIAILISFLQTATTYDTVATAKEKAGKFVHLMARWDKSQPVEYDALKNPNYLAFTAIDTLGQTVRVIYHNPKPENFEISERLVLKGKFIAVKDGKAQVAGTAQPDNLNVSNGLAITGNAPLTGYFDCKAIQTKCPSKYKDEVKTAPAISQVTSQR